MITSEPLNIDFSINEQEEIENPRSESSASLDPFDSEAFLLEMEKQKEEYKLALERHQKKMNNKY